VRCGKFAIFNHVVISRKQYTRRTPLKAIAAKNLQMFFSKPSVLYEVTDTSKQISPLYGLLLSR